MKKMMTMILLTAWAAAGVAADPVAGGPAFAFCIWDASQVREGLALAESLRAFGGSLAEAPIRAYVLEGLTGTSAASVGDFVKFDVEVRSFDAPAAAAPFPFAAKIYAAAEAERDLEAASLLVWMDPDTVVWREPTAFLLDEGKSLGYRPVMHQLIGSPFDEPADAFWSRLYAVLGVKDKSLFPMTTPVDRKTIRPYFNAGLLVVRPGKGLLRAWPGAFSKVAADEELLEMCRADRRKLIFLHQAALAGALLSVLPEEAMVELPESYNYPLNLHEAIPAERRPASLDGVVTLRYDEGALVPGLLKGSGLAGELVDWLSSRFEACR